MNEQNKYIKDETLCLEFVKDNSGEEVKLNDLNVKIRIEKVG